MVNCDASGRRGPYRQASPPAGPAPPRRSACAAVRSQSVACCGRIDMRAQAEVPSARRPTHRSSFRRIMQAHRVLVVGPASCGTSSSAIGPASAGRPPAGTLSSPRWRSGRALGDEGGRHDELQSHRGTLAPSGPVWRCLGCPAGLQEALPQALQAHGLLVSFGFLVLPWSPLTLKVARGSVLRLRPPGGGGHGVLTPAFPLFSVFGTAVAAGRGG
jgi:hypothetical protein